MKKPKPTSTDATLREIFASEEYQAALRERLVSGTAKASEIQLARQLGLLTAEQDDEARTKEGLRQMDDEARSVLMDMLVVSGTPTASAKIRVTSRPGWIGVEYPTTVDANVLRAQNAGQVTRPIEVR